MKSLASLVTTLRRFLAPASLVTTLRRFLAPLRRLYDWVLGWADTRWGLPALLVLAFCESSFFPIPPDVLLMPLVLGASERWLIFAAGTTLASVSGGLAGYAIGFFAWQTLGRWLIENVMHIELVAVAGREDVQLPAYVEKLLDMQPAYLFQTFDDWNAWIVFAFGLTPLPYKLITIAAGFAQVNLLVFVLASVVSRGLRFFGLAFLLHKLGPPAKTFIDRHFNLLAVVFTVLLCGGFVVLGWMF